MSESEKQVHAEPKPRHVRVVCEGGAKNATVYLDGQMVQMCHRARVEFDANGAGLDRFARVTLEIITRDLEIVGDAVVDEQRKTLAELRAARAAASQDAAA